MLNHCRWKEYHHTGRELDHQLQVPKNQMATLVRVVVPKRQDCAHAEKEVLRIEVSTGDRFTKVDSAGCKTAPDEVLNEVRVVNLEPLLNVAIQGV